MKNIRRSEREAISKEEQKEKGKGGEDEEKAKAKTEQPLRIKTFASNAK